MVPGINDVTNVVDRDARLRNVRREDDLPHPARRLGEYSVLLPRRQLRVNGDDEHVAQPEVAHLVHHRLDLLPAGQEDEDRARVSVSVNVRDGLGDEGRAEVGTLAAGRGGRRFLVDRGAEQTVHVVGNAPAVEFWR